jgi:hypothetical protein
MKTKDDPAITRIRKARHSISEGCGHDPQKVVSYYIELQKKYRNRIVKDLEQEENRPEPVKV